ncbi:hypothetical protein ACCS64_39495, partial [Rhizobium ruizarguesonis]
LKLPVFWPIVTVAVFFGGVFLTSLIGGFSTALVSGRIGLSARCIASLPVGADRRGNLELASRSYSYR